jgi:two-component system cell cycle sensor histidine kinase/response regulator CckA
LASNLKEISGNSGQLQQVFVNLLTNAKDALIGKENKKIEISTFCKNENVIVEIKDNGTGITEEIKNKIFEPFFTTKDVNKGTGIGLAIVHSLVTEHSGQIILDSTLGEGSTFKLIFPITTLESNKENAVSDDDVQASKVKGHALIVDDEESILEVLEMYLVDLGMSVKKCFDGQEAFEYLKENTNKVDLIISDIKMPNLDGISFYNKVKQEKLIKNTKFLFMTGGVNSNNLNESIIQKSDGLILKPFTENDVLKKIAVLNLK